MWRLHRTDTLPVFGADLAGALDISPVTIDNSSFSLEASAMFCLRLALAWGRLGVLESYWQVRIGGRISISSPLVGHSAEICFLLFLSGPKQDWAKLPILLMNIPTLAFPLLCPPPHFLASVSWDPFPNKLLTLNSCFWVCSLRKLDLRQSLSLYTICGKYSISYDEWIDRGGRSKTLSNAVERGLVEGNFKKKSEFCNCEVSSCC